MSDWRAEVARALPAITGDPKRDAEIREELAQHCAERAADLHREGVPPPDVRSRTLVELHELAGRYRPDLETAARARDMKTRFEPLSRRARWSRALVDDIAGAVRGLRRAPWFTSVAIVTIALAIAAPVIVFSVVRGVLLRSLPFPDPDRLVNVWEVSPTGNARNVVASGNYLDWAARAQTFDALAALQGPFEIALTGEGDPRRLRAVMATTNLGRVLAVPPARGRLFEATDGVPGGPAVAIIAYDFWSHQLAAREDVIGATLRLNDRAVTVVGVLPEAAHAVLGDVDVVYPVRFSDDARVERRSHNYVVLGRLKSAVSIDQAGAELGGIVGDLTREHPQFLTNWGVSVVSAHADGVRNVRPLLLIAFGVVVVVVGIAGANLANLQLARSSRRGGELSVRAALGAAQGRLVTLLLAENAVLGAAGAIAGIALAGAVLPAVVAATPFRLPLARQIVIDGPVLAFAAAAATLLAIALSLASLPRSSRSLSRRLTGGVRVTGGQQRVRHALIAMQVALSLVLLVATALLLQSLAKLRDVDHGFDPDRVLAVRVDLPAARYPTSAAQVDFYDRLIERLAAVPGVAAIAGTTGQPAVGSPTTFGFAIQGRPSKNPSGREHPVPLYAVTAGFFETMRIPVRSGRTFSPYDRRHGPGVAIINDALAKLHWPEGSALGQRLSFRQGETPWLEIVGVVGNTYDNGLDQEAPPAIYVPFAQKPDNWRWMSWQTIVVRGADDPTRLVPAIRAALHEFDPLLPVLEATPIAAWFAQQGAPRRFTMSLLAAFSGIALLLGALGIYGVLTFLVNARRRELGIRVALGASRRHLTTSIVRTTMAYTVAGLVAGTILAASVTRFLETLLFEIEPTDPLTFLTIAVVLLTVAACAAWIPTRRALAVSAVTALKE